MTRKSRSSALIQRRSRSASRLVRSTGCSSGTQRPSARADLPGVAVAPGDRRGGALADHREPERPDDDIADPAAVRQLQRRRDDVVVRQRRSGLARGPCVRLAEQAFRRPGSGGAGRRSQSTAGRPATAPQMRPPIAISSTVGRTTDGVRRPDERRRERQPAEDDAAGEEHAADDRAHEHRAREPDGSRGSAG